MIDRFPSNPKKIIAIQVEAPRNIDPNALIKDFVLFFIDA